MEIYKFSNEKFKSIYISYNFSIDIKDTKYFSYFSVLAALMTKSSKRYQTQKEIEKYLNSLYGSVFDVTVQKFGDIYDLEFRIEFVNKKFLPSKEELLDKVLLFLEDMIYNPADWTDDMISREKDFIIERINERKDEKLRYGVQRAEELLCLGEPFGTYLYGKKDVVEKITKEDLLVAYNSLMKSCTTVIVSGNLVGYDDIQEQIENVFAKHIDTHENIKDLIYDKKSNIEHKYEIITEYQDTTQSVLSLGLRITDCSQKDFYALNVYNAILGTTPSSKLFQNVREKESLAYTVRSRYYRFKNIIVIFAGINKENYDKALKVINEQIEDLKKGNITDIEFESAKDSLLADLLEWKDSKVAMAKMILSNLISVKTDALSIDQMRDNIRNVTLEDVINVAKKVNVEKVFLLGGENNA